MSKLNIDKSKYDITTPAAKTWLSNVLAGTYYLFQPWHAALAYHLTGNEAHAKKAVATLEIYVNSELLAIDQFAQGLPGAYGPVIDNDSYLYIGGHMRNIVYTLALCSAFVPTELKAKATTLAEQALYNLTNYTKANWKGKLQPWNNWTFGPPYGPDPSSNYYFSFTAAVMYWALYSEEPAWLDRAKAMLTLIDNYWGKVIGGGSMEGTGYGRAQASPYESGVIWTDSTGLALPGLSQHANDMVSYWAHATYPSMSQMVAIGDQSNESSHLMADTDKALMIHASILAGTKAQENAAWWRANVIPKYNVGYPYLAVNDLVTPKAEAKPFTELTKYAETVGHFFARSNWTKLADWLGFSAGPNDQAHEAHDQGALNLYSGGKIILGTQNINTHSGIIQDTLAQNEVVFFDAAGKFINQVRNTKAACKMVFSPGRIFADLSPAYKVIYYDRTEQVVNWTRELAFFSPVRFVIKDVISNMKAGFSHKLVFNSPIVPPVVNGKTITIGPVTLTIKNESANIRVISWKDEEIAAWNAKNPGVPIAYQEHRAGHRIEITGPAGTYETEVVIPVGLPVTGVVEEPPEPPLPSDSEEIVALKAKVTQLQAQNADQSARIDVLNISVANKDNQIRAAEQSIKDRDVTIDAGLKRIADLQKTAIQSMPLSEALAVGTGTKAAVGIDPVKGLVFVRQL